MIFIIKLLLYVRKEIFRNLLLKTHFYIIDVFKQIREYIEIQKELVCFVHAYIMPVPKIMLREVIAK